MRFPKRVTIYCLAALHFHAVSQSYRGRESTYRALCDVDLAAAQGRFVSVVGPSGCGKSTLLQVAAGLLTPDAGRLEVFGEELKGINTRAGVMFQQDALLAWKTVAENIALSLIFQGVRKSDAVHKAGDWILRVGLQGFGASYPYQLSGGMRKRVALAQCWMRNPDIVLMDEPFSALDVHTRMRMESLILDLWQGSGKTVLFVTHDLEEAIALSDEVAVMTAGPGSRVLRVHKVGLPRPRNLLDIRTEPGFGDLYRTIWQDLRGEVLASYERRNKV
jgi:NitT/TauT family transport system ATP-binding protein